MIEENVKKLLGEIKENPFGEKVTVVAAVKMQTPEAINQAIYGGIRNIGDNHVQEFKDKYELITGNPNRHFIGRLQTNKVKYLIGKTYLYHSVDRLELANEISKRSERAEIISDVLLQVNIGDEATKGGFSVNEILSAYNLVKNLPAIKICGLMAMLPFSDDVATLKKLAVLMRHKYDEIKSRDENIKYLSMGMSGDYRICIDCGSNMIRVGTTIFGARNYDK